MPKDFTCDYLVDITGLVDKGANLQALCAEKKIARLS